MEHANIVHSSAWSFSVLVSSGSSRSATAPILNTNAADIFTIAAPAPTPVIASSENCLSRFLSNRTRSPQWVAARSCAAIGSPSGSGISPEQPRIDARETLATASPPQTAAPKPSRTERIELAIDSLQNYELIAPIQVLVESLGDKVFVAEAPDLNVSTTGNSVGAAFLLLKEHIITTYEGYRSKKGLDSERTRQLTVFDKYIGKPRRHWF
jgi:hypothetical protein